MDCRSIGASTIGKSSRFQGTSGFYPHGYIAVHCSFLASLRGSAEFDRITARAAERVAAFNRDVRMNETESEGRARNGTGNSLP